MEVPFIPNTLDNQGCLSVCVAMGLGYVGISSSTQEVDRMMLRDEGVPANIFAGSMAAVLFGAQVNMVSEIDPLSYMEQGRRYYAELIGDEAVGRIEESGFSFDEDAKRLNALYADLQSKGLAERLAYERRQPRYSDLVTAIRRRTVPVICVDPRIIRGNSALSAGHFVVVTGESDNFQEVYIHDPGGKGFKPEPHMQVNIGRFVESWGEDSVLIISR